MKSARPGGITGELAMGSIARFWVGSRVLDQHRSSASRVLSATLRVLGWWPPHLDEGSKESMALCEI
jgi:hypothetical protein